MMEKIEKLKSLEKKLTPAIISTYSDENLIVIVKIWPTFNKIVSELIAEDANKWDSYGIGSFDIKEKMDYINDLPISKLKTAKSEYIELADHLQDSIQKIIEILKENY